MGSSACWHEVINNADAANKVQAANKNCLFIRLILVKRLRLENYRL